MSWDDITDMVAAEKSAGNPIASLIKKLDLPNSSVVLSLPNSMYFPGDDEDDNANAGAADISTNSLIDVTIDLTQSAYNNARDLYQQRAVARSKEEKAAAASDYVIKKVRDQVSCWFTRMKGCVFAYLSSCISLKMPCCRICDAGDERIGGAETEENFGHNPKSAWF